MARPRPPLKPDGNYHVSTRLKPDEMETLEAYRDSHNLTSLNGAVRHWLRNRIDVAKRHYK